MRCSSQVWVRPRISNDAAGFTAIPSDGYPADAKPAQLKNRSELANWGVVGVNHDGEQTKEPWHANVLVMRATADRMFVGGRFTGVQNGPSAAPVDQPSLAAFDNDGNWISSFRPDIDGRVWDKAVTSEDGGRVLLAGYFNRVNNDPAMANFAITNSSDGSNPHADRVLDPGQCIRGRGERDRSRSARQSSLDGRPQLRPSPHRATLTKAVSVAWRR